MSTFTIQLNDAYVFTYWRKINYRYIPCAFAIFSATPLSIFYIGSSDGCIFNYIRTEGNAKTEMRISKRKPKSDEVYSANWFVLGAFSLCFKRVNFCAHLWCLNTFCLLWETRLFEGTMYVIGSRSFSL